MGCWLGRCATRRFADLLAAVPTYVCAGYMPVRQPTGPNVHWQGRCQQDGGATAPLQSTHVRVTRVRGAKVDAAAVLLTPPGSVTQGFACLKSTRR